MAIEPKHVDGRDAGRVILYALSTCVWCKRTKRLLGEIGVAYDYVDVDLLDADDRRRAEDEVRRRNPKRSYPTIVLGDGGSICGFDETKIRERLGT